MTRDIPLLLPDWPVPDNVRAAVTTRDGGDSRGEYASLNLGENTDDALHTVQANRRRLAARLGLARQPAWMRQVHGVDVVAADRVAGGTVGDASWTRRPGVACAVLTADCLPVLLCDRPGTRVAAAHGGWRGLAGGILGNVVRAMNVPGRDLLAWLGPAIGPRAFEVGPEVRQAFTARWPETQAAFLPGRADRLFCDLYRIARLQLAALGVSAVYGGGLCTVEEPERFYSYRRDGARTGRMASLVWLEAPAVAE